MLSYSAGENVSISLWHIKRITFCTQNVQPHRKEEVLVLRRTLCVILAIVLAVVTIPATVFAADNESLQVQVVSVVEKGEGIKITYTAAEGNMPDSFQYALSRNGQFIWDETLDVDVAISGTGTYEFILKFPQKRIPRNTYDFVIWATKDNGNGIVKSSQVYAFKLVLGSTSENVSVPYKTDQGSVMLVQAPFAYVAASVSSMDSPICYLKQGDTVEVYGDIKNDPIVFIKRNDLSGYMYSRVLSSQIFDLKGSLGDKAVNIAMTRVGDPYSQPLAGSGRYLDCSYLAMWTYKQLGIALPRTAADQAQYLEKKGLTVEFDHLSPGDLIFWSYEKNGRYCDISHVGIYAGGNKNIEAVNPRLGVVYRDIPSKDSIVMCARPQSLAFEGELT